MDLKKLLSFVLFLGVSTPCLFAQVSYQDWVTAYRDSVNLEFSDTATSILDPADLKSFTGLHYFEVDTNFCVKATFEEYEKKTTFEMATSTTRKPIYQTYGRLTFVIKGDTLNLEVYQNLSLMKNPEYDDYIFCPFKDLTNGKESYGGGRYLDFRISELKANPEVDFNLCYNPYCAYNYKYSCPVPPKENHLKVRIEAGVKTFH